MKIKIIIFCLFFIFIGCQKKQGSKEVSEKIISLEKEYAELRKLAIREMYNGNWLKAIENFQKCLELKPTDADIHFYLGVAYGNLIKLDKAYLEKSENSYKIFLSLKPDAAEGYYGLAILYRYEYNDIEKALEYINKSIECDKTYLKAYVAKGTFCYEAGLLKEAAETYKKALDLTQAKEKKALYLKNLSKIYLKMGYPDEAEKYNKMSEKIYKQTPVKVRRKGK
ncbi:MAG TPA: tetratricopeptide repeat protein [bacterium]|nr:tetratricopeptide repeat protein [bacterium]HOL47514.1 tetratricopeptide repeat protein [bacterium]HPQ18820.1 tetratricopeptide repeat protein [bacterium]